MLKKEHASLSDLTHGLRLKVQADGELITNGIVDALEEIDVSPALVVNGSADDCADVILETRKFTASFQFHALIVA